MLESLWKRTKSAPDDVALRNLEIARLESVPRHQSDMTRLLGKDLRLVDSASFLSAYRQIFDEHIYRFRTGARNPLIIDCGANIGLAVLYWKQLYESARVIAFEPDPVVFEVLSWNCQQFGLSNVRLINKAVSNQVGEALFYAEGADAGHLVFDKVNGGRPAVPVATVRLSDFLDDEIDLLKIDIEGAETVVLRDCEDLLHRVKHVFVEYHSFLGQEQRLDEIFSILKKNGFRIHIKSELTAAEPFTSNFSYAGMDNSLNVFAYRN
jgi:FkbM family methyltransferase